MNRDSSFADVLTAIFGVRVTSADALRASFYQAARNVQPVPPKCHIKVPNKVYEEYMQLYASSRHLERALTAVLDDYEHGLTLSEAFTLGHDLPDEHSFRDELREYSEYLNQITFGYTKPGQAGYVFLPIDTARSLHNLVDYNCHMVSRICSNVFETDYMKHFGYLKRSGFPYTGKTALQETLDVLQGLRRVSTQNALHVQIGAQNKNWPELVAG